jgi:hypothetical protein
MKADIYLNVNYEEFVGFSVTYSIPDSFNKEDNAHITIEGYLPASDDSIETLRLKAKEQARAILISLTNDPGF